MFLGIIRFPVKGGLLIAKASEEGLPTQSNLTFLENSVGGAGSFQVPGVVPDQSSGIGGTLRYTSCCIKRRRLLKV